jgi:hypothetical protein
MNFIQRRVTFSGTHGCSVSVWPKDTLSSSRAQHAGTQIRVCRTNRATILQNKCPTSGHIRVYTLLNENKQGLYTDTLASTLASETKFGADVYRQTQPGKSEAARSNPTVKQYACNSNNALMLPLRRVPGNLKSHCRP